MEPLLLVFVLGSVIVLIVGLLFYLHDRKARRVAPGEKCSFCGKAKEEVKKLIAGPEVYICNECIGLSSDLITQELGKGQERKG